MSVPTFADAKAALEVKGYGADATAEEALRAAYRQVLADRRWVFLTASDTLSTVAGARTVDLSGIADLDSVDAAVLETAAGETAELEQITASEERYLNSVDHVPDEPVFWTQYDATALRLWPVPRIVYTLNVDYVRSVTAPTDDADELVIPDRYLDVVVWGAVVDLAFRQRDWAASQMATQQFERRLARMAQTHGIRQRSNATHVGHDRDFWDRASL